jgi:NOL1/NOP2/fmu family ribosome biogenesis protein
MQTVEMAIQKQAKWISGRAIAIDVSYGSFEVLS